MNEKWRVIADSPDHEVSDALTKQDAALAALRAHPDGIAWLGEG